MDAEWIEDPNGSGVIHVATGYKFDYLSDMYEYLEECEK